MTHRTPRCEKGKACNELAHSVGILERHGSYVCMGEDTLKTKQTRCKMMCCSKRGRHKGVESFFFVPSCAFSFVRCANRTFRLCSFSRPFSLSRMLCGCAKQREKKRKSERNRRPHNWRRNCQGSCCNRFPFNGEKHTDWYRCIHTHTSHWTYSYRSMMYVAVNSGTATSGGRDICFSDNASSPFNLE